MEKQCNKCGCSLSDGIEQCPNCGEPIKPPIMPTWLLIFICISIPPVGIYAIQAHTYLAKTFKKKLTIILGVWTVIWLSVGMANTLSDNTESTKNTVSDEIKGEEQEETEDDVKKKEEQESKQKKKEKKKKKSKENSKTKEDKASGNGKEKEKKKKKLSKKEYKKQCKEMFYDDVFFSDDSLDGEYLKLHLYFSEKYFFTVDDMYNESTNQFYKDNKLYRDFFKCCVLREGTDSYVGEQINVFFTKNYKLKPSKYKTGDTVAMYGEVVDFAKNYWTGYNQVSFMPKYIEKE